MGLFLLLSLKMNKATRDTEEYEMERDGRKRHIWLGKFTVQEEVCLSIWTSKEDFAISVEMRRLAENELESHHERGRWLEREIWVK